MSLSAAREACLRALETAPEGAAEWSRMVEWPGVTGKPAGLPEVSHRHLTVTNTTAGP